MSRAEAAALLGVTVDADRATAQRAYLRLARQVHPDSAPPAASDGMSGATDGAADSALRFDALSRARAVFETPAPPAPPASAAPRAPAQAPWTRQPSASIGNALLVLVLLVFLLVALVTLDSAIRTHGFEQGAPAAPMPAAVA